MVPCLYVLFGKEYLYAKSFTSKHYEYPLPDKIKVIKKDFAYGVLFGGEPSGSGGYSTVASYIVLESELSEKDLYNYYNKDNVIPIPGEIQRKLALKYTLQFTIINKIKKIRYGLKGIQSLKNNSQRNEGQPIKAIVQIRTEFSYPFFIDFY